MFGSQNLFLSLSTFNLSLMFGRTVFGKLLFSMSLINKYAKKNPNKMLANGLYSYNKNYHNGIRFISAI